MSKCNDFGSEYITLYYIFVAFCNKIYYIMLLPSRNITVESPINTGFGLTSGYNFVTMLIVVSNVEL